VTRCPYCGAGVDLEGKCPSPACPLKRAVVQADQTGRFCGRCAQWVPAYLVECRDCAKERRETVH